jgi:uncharacterized integral membrane protein (TIGR00698 family)
MGEGVTRVVPGLLLLVSLGLLAKGTSLLVPVDTLLLAIGFGVVVGNVLGVPPRFEAGVEQYEVVLEAGIVLMGAYLVIGEIVAAGPRIVLLVLAALTFAILCVEAVSNSLFGIDDKLSSLLASGTAVCGVSAVVATAGGIDADEEQIAYAVATVLVFDALTLVAYPLAGSLLGLGEKPFGVWAGVSMFSTGPVTAAGFAYSEVAGTWATLTKLTRNFFLGGVVVLYSVYYAQSSASGGVRSIPARIWNNFPKFVVGFVLVVALASLQVLSEAQLTSVQNASKWLLTVAFAGMGTHIRLSEMRQAGLRPLLAVAVAFVSISVFSLAAVWFLFG